MAPQLNETPAFSRHSSLSHRGSFSRRRRDAAPPRVSPLASLLGFASLAIPLLVAATLTSCDDAAPAVDDDDDDDSSTDSSTDASADTAGASSDETGDGTDEPTGADDTDDTSDAADTGDTGDTSDTSDTGDTADDTGTDEPTLQFIAATFNTGTPLTGIDWPDNREGATPKEVVDEWYGNGLSFIPLIEITRAYLAEVKPDVIVFQEIFHPGDCADIPPEFHKDFICDVYNDGDPTVAQLVMGEGYQVACNVGKPDKCAAIRTDFATFRDCDKPFCLDGMFGTTVEGCGKGSRIGRAIVDTVSGETFTLVNVHGSSGFAESDEACRVKQFEQVFVDLGDGKPAANGTRNLIMGDFNTDPYWFVKNDPSAQKLLEFAGPGRPFAFLTEYGLDANGDPYPGTYSGLPNVNIDHVISDVFAGPCWASGVTDGYPAVAPVGVFDHVLHVCNVTGD